MLVATAVTVVLAGCAGTDTPPPSTTRSARAAPYIDAAAASEPPEPVRLMQHIGNNTRDVRWLDVEPNGGWTCENCAGDHSNSKGTLSTAQNGELHHMLGSAQFRQEVLQLRGRRFTCDGALYSTLFTGPGAITLSDCAGEQRLPVADAILHLLADATLAQAARTVTA